MTERENYIYENAREYSDNRDNRMSFICGALWADNHPNAIEQHLEVKNVDVDKEARHYLLYEHESPLFRILHEIDLLIEMQYHRDIENAFKAGYELGVKMQKGE